MRARCFFAATRGDFALATLDFARDEAGEALITDHRCGRRGPGIVEGDWQRLYALCAGRIYNPARTRGSPALHPSGCLLALQRESDAWLASDPALYVPAEQVRDLVQVVFDAFVSESIQHLVHELGCRLLERFPQLACGDL